MGIDGTRINAYRVRIGMTICELSNRTRIPEQTLTAIETGERMTIPAKDLARIAAAMGTTIDRLFFTHWFYDRMNYDHVTTMRPVKLAQFLAERTTGKTADEILKWLMQPV